MFGVLFQAESGSHAIVLHEHLEELGSETCEGVYMLDVLVLLAFSCRTGCDQPLGLSRQRCEGLCGRLRVKLKSSSATPA